MNRTSFRAQCAPWSPDQSAISWRPPAPATKQTRAADQMQDEWFPAALHSARSIASLGSLVVPSYGCEAWAESIRQMKTSVNLQSTSACQFITPSAFFLSDLCDLDLPVFCL